MGLNEFSENCHNSTNDKFMACTGNPDELNLDKKNPKGLIPISKLLQSNCPLVDVSLSYLSYDKASFSAVSKFSTSRFFESFPDIHTFRHFDLSKPYQDQLKAYPEKTLPPTENLSKATSATNYSRSKGELPFSQETGSNGKIPVPIDVSESRDSEKILHPAENFSKETSAASYSRSNREPMVKNASSNGIDGDINVLNAKEALPLAILFDKPYFETDTSLLAPENIEIPEFHHDCEKLMQELNLMRLVSVCTKASYDDDFLTCPVTSSNHLSISKNKPLKETLKILANWARKGLDTIFNGPLKFGSEEIGTNLEIDLKYGLGVMKEITTRIYALMTAANLLPDIDPKLIPRFQSIRNDFNLNLMEMWNIVDDLKLQVYTDYKNIKLAYDKASGKGINDTKQGEKSKVFITNAYTVVIEKLPLLCKQLDDIREKVRIICSEIERLL